MGKKYYLFYLIFFFTFSILNYQLIAQVFNGEWTTDYVTEDDRGNGTGQRTLAVAALEENTFVALVSRESINAFFIIGYKNADSVSGRLGQIGYGGELQDFRTRWINGFNQTDFDHPKGIAAMGSTVYVTNNDANHFILTFDVTTDTVVSHPARLSTGSENIWAIDIDDNGKVYVTQEGDSTNPGAVLIFDNETNEPAWTSGSNVGTPLQTITLPDPGSARGIAVNENGSVIYVSNYLSKKVYCYIGDPSNGYTLYDGFNFNVDTTFIASDSTSLSVGPFGMRYMRGNNLLFVSHDADFLTGAGYEYGRIYIADPNTGDILDTINVAEWNKKVTGVYNNKTNGLASGYASVYSVDFDVNKNVYSQSFYGWTVDKWKYSGTLPTIELTITDVKKEISKIPTEFSLSQNYPNPFNPATTIKFSLKEDSKISLNVYTINGELVTTLIDNTNFASGVYRISFDASKLASGTYIYKLTNGTSSITKKMILLK